LINLLPEPKRIRDDNALSEAFDKICFMPTSENIDSELLMDIAKLRFWNYKEIDFCTDCCDSKGLIKLIIAAGLDGIETENEELFKSQGYHLLIENSAIILRYENKAGFINGITSIKQLLKKDGNLYKLPCC